MIELAERYVELYQKNGGVGLSNEEFHRKVSEVVKFYSEPIRENRLQKLVSSFLAQ